MYSTNALPRPHLQLPNDEFRTTKPGDGSSSGFFLSWGAILPVEPSRILLFYVVRESKKCPLKRALLQAAAHEVDRTVDIFA